MSILMWLVLSLISAILYRIGGSSLRIPMKTKYRDWGVPLCGLIFLAKLLAITSWWYYGALAGFFLFSFGSLCTYFDHWGTDDVEWYEWALTGFIMGMAALPIAVYTGRWIGFILRTIILTIFMPFSNRLQFEILWDETDLVEASRGFMFTATLPLLIL